jgi:hypothetical protein
LIAVVGALAVTAMLAPATAAAQPDSGAPPGAYAELDGRPLKLREVGKYYCHDFDFPKITCSRNAKVAQKGVDEAVSELATASFSTDIQASSMEEGSHYATIYDGMTFSGSWFVVSQEYDALFWVGWNDRVSSFRSRYYGSGSFYTDWYGGGSGWRFCCNQYVSSLGGYDNSFSSVYRN